MRPKRAGGENEANNNVSTIAPLKKHRYARVGNRRRSWIPGIRRHSPLPLQRGPLTAEDDAWAIKYKELKIGQKIGQGNVGVVFAGKWKGTNVAVKKLLGSWFNDADMVGRFREEIRLMSTLRHPNVLLFIGAVMDPSAGNMCLVTEFCEHGNLYDFLHDPNEKMTWKMRLVMATDTARAMAYLHRRAGIIQRDLKSANLLIAEGHHIKIADFGLSRRLAPPGQAMETYCGTPAYMAPEIVRQEDYSETADVFSFSIILWELVTREKPYPNLAGLALAYAVANDNLRPSIPAYCPYELANLIEACWDTKHKQRPDFETILQVLEGIQEEISRIRRHKRESVVWNGVRGNLVQHLPTTLSRSATQKTDKDIATTVDRTNF